MVVVCSLLTSFFALVFESRRDVVEAVTASASLLFPDVAVTAAADGSRASSLSHAGIADSPCAAPPPLVTVSFTDDVDTATLGPCCPVERLRSTPASSSSFFLTVAADVTEEAEESAEDGRRRAVAAAAAASGCAFDDAFNKLLVLFAALLLLLLLLRFTGDNRPSVGLKSLTAVVRTTSAGSPRTGAATTAAADVASAAWSGVGWDVLPSSVFTLSDHGRVFSTTGSGGEERSVSLGSNAGDGEETAAASLLVSTALSMKVKSCFAGMHAC